VELGLEFGIGVNVATMATVLPLATVAGAASCNEKLLVMFRLAVANFDASAALCAFTTTVLETGKICGAV
jgi:hypothetical protein